MTAYQSERWHDLFVATAGAAAALAGLIFEIPSLTAVGAGGHEHSLCHR